jgi:UDP-N-acetylmuramoyl-L-alanyl-D-glutamate--2,6-diaminopimelate ligase
MGDEPRRRTVALSRLAAAAGIDPGDEGSAVDPMVSDVTHDHREVRPGSLFCCIVGTERDGHDLASEAVTAGAVALVVQRPTGAGVPELVVSDTRAAMGVLAAEFWGNPSTDLAVVGVTGTNGKTTVVTLIDEILTTLGVTVGTIGTLTGVRTTPESTDLQRTLAAMRDSGISVVALEVSSHALALGRVDGCHFAVAAFTNLGVDHLDFHETPERYFEAKARLFEPARCQLAVVNRRWWRSPPRERRSSCREHPPRSPGAPSTCNCRYRGVST